MKLKLVAPIHFLYDHPRDTLKDTLELEKNLVLTRFDPKFIEPVTTFFTKLYSGHDIEDLKNCEFCIIYDFDSDSVDQDKAQKKVHRFLESLRIIRPTRAACSTSLLSTDRNGNLKAEGASQKSSSVYITYGEELGAQHFVRGEEKRIKKYFNKVSKMYEDYEGKYNRVLNAFIFFQLGYLTHYAKLRIVPFVIALESLFNTSEQEIGYSLRMRCAAFLGKNKAEKESIIQRIKSIYELRSKVVHGSTLPKKVIKNPLKSNVIIREAEDFCRRCFQKIFDEDLVKVFSLPNDKLAQYLDNMIIS